MAGYRRFVAYVYEYRQGKKSANCGFVKVEARSGRCTIELHLQCRGLTPKAECRIYGFVRRKGIMNGILLGSCLTQEDRAVCRLETEEENMNGSGVSLEQMGGLVFLTELGGFFGTEWDDESIRPDHFREEPGADEPLAGEEEQEAEDREEEPEEPEEEMQAEKSEEQAEGAEGQAEEAEGQEGEPQVQAEEVQAELPKPPCSGRTVWEPRNPEKIGEGFCPFEDEEFRICRKIHPHDLMRLSRRECVLRNNRFLSYGYSNFGHLLLAQRRDGQFILGVPGVYDQQEHFMAKMFGFPWFKKSGFIELPDGHGGYWYRLIDAPDAD